MKDEWTFMRHMNALKQQLSLNRWCISKSKQLRSKWNAKIDKKRRIQTDKNKDRCVSLNFALSCYHHHCYCSNERFFKFEAFLSTLIESLLIFFAVAFIFYYQVIVVRSMFNSHQIDLSSKNSFFIFISSVSFSLIMFATVRYMIFILASRFSKTLYFDEHNITEFFKRFEKQYDKYKIIKKNKWIKLSRYCVKIIAEFMKIFSSYVDRNWKIFEKKIQKEYKDQNIKQIINFHLFLKKFKNKVRKNNQIRIYSRWFKNISIKLIKWKHLNIYTQCSWYLQRLSNFYRIKLICKYNFNFSDSNIMIFKFVYKTVIGMIDINNTLKELNILSSKKNKNNIDKLINLIKTDQKTNKFFNLETAFASSILSAISI